MNSVHNVCATLVRDRINCATAFVIINELSVWGALQSDSNVLCCVVCCVLCVCFFFVGPLFNANHRIELTDHIFLLVVLLPGSIESLFYISVFISFSCRFRRCDD